MKRQDNEKVVAFLCVFRRFAENHHLRPRAGKKRPVRVRIPVCVRTSYCGTFVQRHAWGEGVPTTLLCKTPYSACKLIPLSVCITLSTHPLGPNITSIIFHQLEPKSSHHLLFTLYSLLLLLPFGHRRREFRLRLGNAPPESPRLQRRTLPFRRLPQALGLVLRRSERRL